MPCLFAPPFTSLSAVALLTIAVGITTDGARSKAFFLAGAASSAGAATLRKRGDILSLKEENERQRDSATAAAREDVVSDSDLLLACLRYLDDKTISKILTENEWTPSAFQE